MEITKHLLMNLSLLLVLLFFTQLIIERQVNEEKREIYQLFYFIISIFTCYIFSVQVQDGIRFDLRQVPMILGGLYTGYSFLLAGLTLLMRALLGINDGFWVSVGVFSGLAILLKWIHPWFNRLSLNSRVGVSVLLTVITSFLLMQMVAIVNEPISHPEAWISFILIPALTSGLVSYSIETIRQTFIIRQRLAKADKIEAVSHLSASISHEIRNPLTTVKGFLQLLGEKDYPEDKKKEFIDIAVQELKRAEEVINDYLTFARPAFEKEEKIEVEKELNHVLNVLSPLANLNGVKITKKFSPGLFISGDRSKFKQGFINLMKNGLEAMPNGGELIIQTFLTGSVIHILVRDTGIGMNEEQIARLGEPYYTTKGKQGTGLGMMVTFSIIRAMRGKVEVKSQIGMGTTFHIRFTKTL
ncbi:MULTISPECIES: sensor histidine kinase [Mesobacillus]|uniref:histidine kinase n=1 Tax=Mesobacillus selenatarsenatis TaxID=388741 RepID=A0A846TPA1_9BACI|nr:sensor histidine kinase [Mesobacillus sp. S13]NKE04251.1 sensor histidine kinase [Mesobacillus selenatarsenatis]